MLGAGSWKVPLQPTVVVTLSNHPTLFFHSKKSGRKDNPLLPSGLSVSSASVFTDVL